jgi:2-keto-4-pentenoate hydratase/2-oxohepta-3-ene-1,7-dioic acid hydratase in catechol pathway
MHIITFAVNGQTRWGAAQGDQAVDLNLAHAMLLATRGQAPEYIAQSALEFIQRGERAWQAAQETLEFIGSRAVEGVVFLMGSVKLLAPIPRPPKIVAIGQNYMDHCREQNVEPPKKPILFAKYPTAVTGPYDPIHIVPDVTQRADFEAELGVVMGKAAYRVSAASAFDYIFGYTVLNDVSARDIQLGPDEGRQWVRGKSFDTFCPMGPAIVTRDQVPNPQNLPILTRLNGQVMQDSNTKEMIFGIAELIEFITQGITLEPGDVIATGTPNGVGVFRKPPVYLHPGDVIEIQIDGIGQLRNPVQA